MKKYLISGVVCLFLCSCGMGVDGFTPPNPGAERTFTYHFDENGGSIAKNADSNGYFDGELYGPTWVPGKVGSALQFGSTGESYVEILPGLLNGAQWFYIPFDSGICVAAWIKMDSSPQSEPYSIIGSGGHGMTFRLQINTSGQVEFLLGDYQGWHTIVTSNQVLTPGVWHYIAVTYDETTGRLYVDGIEDNSRAISYGVEAIGDPLFVGSIAPGVNQFFGVIDEVRISKDLWTAQQIADYYNSTN